MLKIMKKSARMKRIEQLREKIYVDVVFVGEGPKEGVAYRHAVSHPEEKLVIIEPLASQYCLPPNVTYIQGDALKWLEFRAPETVGNVRDDYALTWITQRIGSSDPGVQLQRLLELRKLAIISDYIGGLPKGAPNIRRNARRYFSFVKKVLVPNGKFQLTSDINVISTAEEELSSVGFSVSVESLGSNDISNESREAQNSFREGQKVYRLIGIKTSNGKSGVENIVNDPQRLREMGRDLLYKEMFGRQ